MSDGQPVAAATLFILASALALDGRYVLATIGALAFLAFVAVWAYDIRSQRRRRGD